METDRNTAASTGPDGSGAVFAADGIGSKSPSGEPPVPPQQLQQAAAATPDGGQGGGGSERSELSGAERADEGGATGELRRSEVGNQFFGDIGSKYSDRSAASVANSEGRGEGDVGGQPSRAARRYKTMRFSDGGTVANNPAFIALQEAWALYG